MSDAVRVIEAGFVQEFRSEWKIEKLTISNDAFVKTPEFCPIPHCDAKFFIKLWYPSNESRTNNATLKFSLMRIPCSATFPFRRMKLKFTLNYIDGEDFTECSCASPIDLAEFRNITFLVGHSDDNRLNPLARRPIGNHTREYSLLNQSISFILKCRMEFFDFADGYFPVDKHLRLIWSKQTLAKDFCSIYKSSVFSDIEISVEESLFLAHKAVLAAHSQVFLKMFTDDFRESTSNRITISDTAPNIFEFFLNYLYSGEIQDKSWPNVRDLYVLADKYDVEALKLDCAEIIISCISADNVCDILKLAYACNDSFMKQEAKKMAVIHIKYLSETDVWKDLVLSHPILGYELIGILSSESTRNCSIISVTAEVGLLASSNDSYSDDDSDI